MKIWTQLVVKVARKWKKKHNFRISCVLCLNSTPQLISRIKFDFFSENLLLSQKTTLLQREPFFVTMFYTIHSSPLLVTKVKLLCYRTSILSNYYQWSPVPLKRHVNKLIVIIITVPLTKMHDLDQIPDLSTLLLKKWYVNGNWFFVV